MITELQKYEKAWGLFVKWFIDKLGILGDFDNGLTKEDCANELIFCWEDDEFDMLKLNGLIQEFLDEQKIIIEMVYDMNAVKKWCPFITLDFDTKDNDEFDIEEIYYSTRPEAFEAGAIKSFEILENNQKEK